MRVDIFGVVVVLNIRREDSVMTRGFRRKSKKKDKKDSKRRYKSRKRTEKIKECIQQSVWIVMSSCYF